MLSLYKSEHWQLAHSLFWFNLVCAVQLFGATNEQEQPRAKTGFI